jgi:aminoglycoside phosphotransferase (APT) family kinase protein
MPADELDIENFDALLRYLRGAGRIAPDETPRFTQLTGGVSNRTVLVERTSPGESWVLKQALAKLRVQVEWFSDPRRIEREAAGIRCLTELAPAGTITPLLFFDAAHHLLAMQAVPQPHENWKAMLLAGRVEGDHVGQFARLLGQVHRSASKRAATLAPQFEDRSFFHSLRLEPYYLYAAEHVPAAATFLHDLVDRTWATRYTLVHGDFSPKNVLVRKGRLVLLDHEVIHWGDGTFDLGFSLAHLLSKAHHLTEHRDAFARAARQYWHEYHAEIGHAPWSGNVEDAAVRHALACLLARCCGRSPLEYLSAAERQRQRDAVVSLIGARPNSVVEMIDAFLNEIEHRS